MKRMNPCYATVILLKDSLPVDMNMKQKIGKDPQRRYTKCSTT